MAYYSIASTATVCGALLGNVAGIVAPWGVFVLAAQVDPFLAIVTGVVASGGGLLFAFAGGAAGALLSGGMVSMMRPQSAEGLPLSGKLIKSIREQNKPEAWTLILPQGSSRVIETNENSSKMIEQLRALLSTIK